MLPDSLLSRLPKNFKYFQVLTSNNSEYQKKQAEQYQSNPLFP